MLITPLPGASRTDLLRNLGGTRDGASNRQDVERVWSIPS